MTHLVSSPVFSLDCRIVALWRWGWESVFDTKTCCFWGRVCACWRSAGWPDDPSLPCAVGSASWRGRPSCCALLTRGARRASLSRQASQPPRMMDRDGQQNTAQKTNKKKSFKVVCCYWCQSSWVGCWFRVSEVALIWQCRTSSVTVSYYQSHVAVEKAKHWQSMLLSSTVLYVPSVCCPVQIDLSGNPGSTYTHRESSGRYFSLHRLQMLSVSHSGDRCTSQIQKWKLQCIKRFRGKKTYKHGNPQWNLIKKWTQFQKQINYFSRYIKM